uniref:Uncharacterized protein n=1 Tax=Trichogramma kaykai TaxID=54128 RepID=A0ABD2X5N6_9HYME
MVNELRLLIPSCIEPINFYTVVYLNLENGNVYSFILIEDLRAFQKKRLQTCIIFRAVCTRWCQRGLVIRRECTLPSYLPVEVEVSFDIVLRVLVYIDVCALVFFEFTCTSFHLYVYYVQRLCRIYVRQQQQHRYRTAVVYTRYVPRREVHLNDNRFDIDRTSHQQQLGKTAYISLYMDQHRTTS